VCLCPLMPACPPSASRTAPCATPKSPWTPGSAFLHWPAAYPEPLDPAGALGRRALLAVHRPGGPGGCQVGRGR
jgi:hypothetical protein